jgi:hypothetical protein
MVVHHANGLHMGIADGGTDETEATAEQVFAHEARTFGLGGYFITCFPGVDQGLAADELPKISIEAAELLLDFQERLSILDGSADLEPVANNPRISQQLRNLLFIVLGDFNGIKVVKSQAVVLPFAQDGGPAETSLCTLQDEKFEQEAIIVDGNAPFLIMVSQVERIVCVSPEAASSRRFKSWSGPYLI